MLLFGKRSLSRSLRILRYMSSSLSKEQDISNQLSTLQNSEQYISFVKNNYKQILPEDISTVIHKALQLEEAPRFLQTSHVLDYLMLKHGPYLDQFALVDIFIDLSKLGPSYALMAASKLMIYYAHRIPLDDLIVVDMAVNKLDHLSYIRELRKALLIAMHNNYLQIRIVNPILILYFIKLLGSDENELITYSLSCLIKHHKEKFYEVSVQLLDVLAHHNLRNTDYIVACCNYLTDKKLNLSEALSTFQSLSKLHYFSFSLVNQIMVRAANANLDCDEALTCVACMERLSVVSSELFKSCLGIIDINKLDTEGLILILRSLAKFSPLIPSESDYVEQLKKLLASQKLSSFELFSVIESLYCLKADASRFVDVLMNDPHLSDLTPKHCDFMMRSYNVDYFKTNSKSLCSPIPERHLEIIKNICKKHDYRFALNEDTYCSDALIFVDNNCIISLLMLNHSDFIQNQGRLNGFAQMKKQMADREYLNFFYFKPKYQSAPSAELELMIEKELKLVIERSYNGKNYEPSQL